MVDYRQRLATALRSRRGPDAVLRLRVGFRDWRLLIAWCQRMSSVPKALESEVDIGLPLLYPDGATDRISFASLFADVRDISTKKLPADCFERTPVKEPWTLKNGLPQIGALIAECGEVGDAASAAEEALRLLPLGTEPLQSNLRKILPDDPLALGLAVLFRALEIYRSDDHKWERIWSEGHWHPGRLVEVEEPGDYDWALPVKEWVKMAEAALEAVVSENKKRDMSGCADGYVDVDAIAEKLRAIAPSQVRRELSNAAVSRHLEFLCDLGAAESVIAPNGEITYRIRSGQREADWPSRPPRPPAAKTGLTWDSDALPVYLRDSLGFGSRGPGGPGVNDNAIGQILHDAFMSGMDDSTPTANERAKNGREFLETFRTGDAPAWIKDTCRNYCVDVLRWRDERNWPRCISPRA